MVVCFNYKFVQINHLIAEHEEQRFSASVPSSTLPCMCNTAEQLRLSDMAANSIIILPKNIHTIYKNVKLLKQKVLEAIVLVSLVRSLPDLFNVQH